MSASSEGGGTRTTIHIGRVDLPKVVVCVRGSAELPATLGLMRFTIGSDLESDLCVKDPSVSRRHLALELTEAGLLARDLGSKNGTFVGATQIREAVLTAPVSLRIGECWLEISREAGVSEVPLSKSVSFGQAIGASMRMRALFSRLERVAKTDETVLLLGESGTGKEVLARALHDESHRKDGAFVVLDCSSLSENLIEAELFGHSKGAFTGALASRAGLFEAASGGTLFIDEIGELPMELQAKLLRALEQREVRRLGETEARPLDVRVIAATHRDLRVMVREHTFREDLYYRLSVIEQRVPALRERTEDIELLVERFLREYTPPRSWDDLPEGALSLLERHSFPGNVRELRNLVARLVLFPEELPHFAEVGVSSRIDALPLREARDFVVADFERRYIEAQLQKAAGNVSRAAEKMGISRQLLHRMMKQYGMGREAR